MIMLSLFNLLQLFKISSLGEINLILHNHKILFRNSVLVDFPEERETDFGY